MKERLYLNRVDNRENPLLLRNRFTASINNKLVVLKEALNVVKRRELMSYKQLYLELCETEYTGH